jgi:hypothetical protein
MRLWPAPRCERVADLRDPEGGACALSTNPNTHDIDTRFAAPTRLAHIAAA